MQKSFTIRKVEVVHQGYYPKLVVELSHERFDGGTEAISRDLLDLGPTATVLPYDPVRDAVLLVEQFRAAPWRLNDDPWILEAVAGRCDQGEDPATAARREALEEAGVTLTDLAPVTTAYTSPGCLAEHTAVFIGHGDFGATGRFGGSDPGEDIRIHVVPFAEAMAMAADGRLRALSALVALFWLALNRDALRRRWLSVIPPSGALEWPGGDR